MSQNLMLTPTSTIHYHIWVSLYFRFEVIIYRTRGLETNYELLALRARCTFISDYH